MCATRKTALPSVLLAMALVLAKSGDVAAKDDAIWPVETDDTEIHTSEDVGEGADADAWLSRQPTVADAPAVPNFEDDKSDFKAIDGPFLESVVASEAANLSISNSGSLVPPRVNEFGDKILNHPTIRSAKQRVCEAKYDVLKNRAGYYPNVSVSLSGGNKIIDETTRADEYGGTNSPEYDGSGINATLTLRQSLYDWGRLSSIVEGSQQGFHIAQLERRLTLEEQLRLFFISAYEYQMENDLVEIFTQARDAIADSIEAMQARFKAGAARIIDVRQAQIIGLEIEGRLSQAQRQRNIFIDAIKTKFGLEPNSVDAILDYFGRARPDIPDIIPAYETLQTRLIHRNIARVQTEYKRLQAENKPMFTGVLTGRAWDVGHKNRCNDPVARGHPDAGTRSAGTRDGTRYYYRDQNCSTHELTGAVEFSMPLFDGGANAAQRGGVNAQRIGLESNLEAYQRNHGARSMQFRDSLQLLIRQKNEIELRLSQLSERLESIRLLQTQTQSDPLGLITVHQQFADRRSELASNIIEAEVTRVELLALAAGLSKVMKISLGGPGC